MKQKPTLWERGGGWVVGQGILLACITVAPWIAPRLAIAGGLLLLARLLGGVFVLGGGALALLSVQALGRNLTPLPYPKDAGERVEQGPYRIVRHPIYSGILLGCSGWAFFWASLPALILTVLLGWLFDAKARREEAWLTERYPDYRQYCQRVRRFLPWIY